MTHPTFTLLAAALLAIAFAMLEDRSSGERARVAVRVFLTCMAVVAGGGWLMYLVHG
jgi:hypothetical protein